MKIGKQKNSLNFEKMVLSSWNFKISPQIENHKESWRETFVGEFPISGNLYFQPVFVLKNWKILCSQVYIKVDDLQAHVVLV